jgi:hypothetical protein
LVSILWAAYFGLRGSCSSATGKLARGVFIWVALVGSITWIGLFEGGYNHALKVILFQLDLPYQLFSAYIRRAFTNRRKIFSSRQPA